MGVCVSHSFQTNLLVFSLLSPGFWPGLGILMFWALGFHISLPVLEGVFTIIQHHQPPIRSIPLHPATISHNYIPRKSWKNIKIHENPMTNWINPRKCHDQLDVQKIKIPLRHGCFFLLTYPSLIQAAQPFSKGRLHPLPTLGWQNAVEHGFHVWFYYP